MAVAGGLVLAGAITVAGCGDRPNAPMEPAAIAASQGDVRATAKLNQQNRQERLARLLARALRDPETRAYIKTQLDNSRFREHKLQFQWLLRAGNGQLLRQVARAGETDEAELGGFADGTAALEVYFPFPEHRTQWTGDANIQVATVIDDDDQAVIFTPAGGRQVTAQSVRPTTPTLVVTPVETKFDEGPSFQICTPETCGTGGGGGGGDIGDMGGLHMRAMDTDQEYEGAFKGEPEFEVHILGPVGSTDSLKSYQCAGANAGFPYTFDSNTTGWTGDVLLFTPTQINNFKTLYPGKAWRVFIVEDDDGTCVLKLDGDRATRMFNEITAALGLNTGTKDTVIGVQKAPDKGNPFAKLISAAASFITTKDDTVGNAVEDEVVGQIQPGRNWFIKADNNTTHGYLQLEMK